MILNVKNNPPKVWRAAAIPKKDGSSRYLLIPNDELKKAQTDALWWLYSKRLPIHSADCGFVPGRRILDGIMRHDRNADVIINLDIDNFFPSFPVEKVNESLNRHLEAHETDYIMSLAVFEGKKRKQLPQGSPLSPFLTSVAMGLADNIITSIADRYHYTYSRYADDMTFASKDEQAVKHIKQLIHCVKEVLKEKYNMRLSWEKTTVMFRNSSKVPRRITGVSIRKDNKGYGAPSGFRRTTRAKVHNLYMKLKGGAKKEDLFGDYLSVMGCVQYCDYLRSANEDGFGGADPKIQAEKLQYIMEVYNAC